MRAIALTVVLLVAAGCASAPTEAEWKSKALSFVQDGSSTREQILLKLGGPTAEFESGRILTYRIARSGPDGVAVVSRERIRELGTESYAAVDYSLVLVFEGEVLAKHSLVPVR